MKICYIFNFSFPPKYGHTLPFMYSTLLAKKGHRITILGREIDKDYSKIPNLSFVSIDAESDFLFAIKVCKFLINNVSDFNLINIVFFESSILIHLVCKLIFKHTKICNDIKSGPIGRFPIKGKIKRILCSVISDVIFLQSSEMTKTCIASWQRKKTHILPIGFYNVGNKPNSRAYSPVETIFIYIGSIAPFRRLDIMLKAFALAYRQNTSIKLLILGGGPSKSDLERLSIKMGLSGCVEFKGIIPLNRIPDYLQLADVGISYIPIKKYNEMPPLKVLEYLGAGLPVIATATDGTSNFVKEGHNGLLIDDDADSLCRAILKLSKNRNLIVQLSKNAKESVKKFTWEQIIENYVIPTYQSIILS